MDDLEGFLASGVVSARGKKSTLDSACQAVVERDVTRFNRDGELTGFFAVHGGYAGGTGTQYIAENLQQCVAARREYDDELYLALENGMLDCQRGLYEQWNRSGLMHGSNSTVMVVRDGYSYFVNAGGGAAVLCGVEGAVKVLTSASARFDELEHFTCYKYLPDCEDEFVLLGCDGFWEKMRPEQSVRMVRSALRKYRSVKYACEKLSYAAQVAGAKRNINVLVVLLNADAALGIPAKASLEERQSILAQLYGRGAGKSNLHTSQSEREGRDTDSMSDSSSVTSASSVAPTKKLSHLFSPKARVCTPPPVTSPAKNSSRLVVNGSRSSTPRRGVFTPPEPDILSPRQDDETSISASNASIKPSRLHQLRSMA
ncbi:Protein phosphatase 2C 57 [Porphyridium purpureum]|uniref:Protein phosphatase 2C 57 n=1 Tax=Porphyridium purpureum TaxID=35688 RepID=A0A5J4YR97_PORPP|nr:Protein phosphatase 2C 57 [Porphyridium purpureum]|eukprot:POR4387..scf296_7